MRRRLGSWARPTAGLLALTLALAGAAPVAASEAAPPLTRPTTLSASANATVAAMPIAAGALAQAAPAAQASATTDTGKGFFKTGAGKVALVLMLAGTSYMVYSAFKDNDPVEVPVPLMRGQAMKSLTRSFALLLLVLAAATAGAQSFSGTVSGIVTDEQGGALPGATVTLTGKTGSRTTVTDAKGEYRFTAVDPGTYDISAELTGFRPMKRTDVQVSIGKTVEGLFTMKVGGLTETVDVLGESPLVDVTSSATDNNLSQDILFNFPIRYGNVATALLNYLPGINNESAYGGDAGSGNALLIDGVDTRDPSGGTAWTFYNFNIVEEVQAVGVGAPAEFGAFSGAVINTVTKSGGNRYSGLFDVTYTNDRTWPASNINDTIKKQNPSLGDPAKTNAAARLHDPAQRAADQGQALLLRERPALPPRGGPLGPAHDPRRGEPPLQRQADLAAEPERHRDRQVQYDSYNIIGRAASPRPVPPTTSRTRKTRPSGSGSPSGGTSSARRPSPRSSTPAGGASTT